MASLAERWEALHQRVAAREGRPVLPLVPMEPSTSPDTERPDEPADPPRNR